MIQQYSGLSVLAKDRDQSCLPRAKISEYLRSSLQIMIAAYLIGEAPNVL